MPRSSFAGNVSSPKVDFIVDMGNPLLNQTLDGFLKIGSVAVAKVAVEETYGVIKRGSVSSHSFEHSLKKMCKEGAYWGVVAGVYVGTQYGIERVRGTRDWKNAMIGGALTGALVSAASSSNTDKIVMDAIVGGAVVLLQGSSVILHDLICLLLHVSVKSTFHGFVSAEKLLNIDPCIFYLTRLIYSSIEYVVSRHTRRFIYFRKSFKTFPIFRLATDHGPKNL